MLHPVGDLPAAVYWRRRLVVLVALVSLLVGAGWLAVHLAGRGGTDTPSETTASSSRPVASPAPERVEPSLAGLRTTGQAPATPLTDVRPSPSFRATLTATACEAATTAPPSRADARSPCARGRR